MAYKDKEAGKAKYREAYQLKKESEQFRHKQKYLDNKEKYLLQKMEYEKTYKVGRAITTISRLYNINQDAASDLYLRSMTFCDACKEPWDPLKKRLAIDHDHDTGAIRGILCHGCNTSLGLLKESQDRLTKLSAYLSTVCGK
jgi:hypothetical protein